MAFLTLRVDDSDDFPRLLGWEDSEHLPFAISHFTVRTLCLLDRRV